MNVLCIGPGVSALEHIDFAQFNNFDYKIGCRELLNDLSWQPLDYVVTTGILNTRWTLDTYPEYNDIIITSTRPASHHSITIVPEIAKQLCWCPNENLYSVQARLAVILKSKTVTTIGWDILNNSYRTMEDTRYRIDHPIQLHPVDKRLVNHRITKLREPLGTVMRVNSNIEWNHRTSVLSTA